MSTRWFESHLYFLVIMVPTDETVWRWYYEYPITFHKLLLFFNLKYSPSTNVVGQLLKAHSFVYQLIISLSIRFFDNFCKACDFQCLTIFNVILVEKMSKTIEYYQTLNLLWLCANSIFSINNVRIIIQQNTLWIALGIPTILGIKLLIHWKNCIGTSAYRPTWLQQHVNILQIAERFLYKFNFFGTWSKYTEFYTYYILVIKLKAIVWNVTGIVCQRTCMIGKNSKLSIRNVCVCVNGHAVVFCPRGEWKPYIFSDQRLR